MADSTALITRIGLENYRGFPKYEIRNLSCVNLLVGKNNCGKTSILEAVQLLASGGDPLVFSRTALARGEVSIHSEVSERYPRQEPEISHLFCGHRLFPGASFGLRTDSKWGDLIVSIVEATQDTLFPEQRTLFSETDHIEGIEVGQVFVLEIRNGRDTGRPIRIPVSERGTLHPDSLRRRGYFPTPNKTTAVQFITPDSLLPGSMGEMWDQVILEGRENEVISALRILEPKLENVFFLSGERSYRFGNRAGVLVAFEGEKHRVPLGSFGEGMRRFLALSLSLINSAGGVLLVDEIDTGLHWSVMQDMWRLVIAAAKNSQVQVFATTHSFDCLQGLSSLCEREPGLAAQVSLQKIDPELDASVALDAEHIALAMEQDIEVR